MHVADKELTAVIDRRVAGTEPKPGDVLAVTVLGETNKIPEGWWGPLPRDEYERRRAETS